MTDTPRHANGQPVGYSNRNLCPKCAGDLGDCNCPPPPADAALLRSINGLCAAPEIICDDLPDGSVACERCDNVRARLRALADQLEREDNERRGAEWRAQLRRPEGR